MTFLPKKLMAPVLAGLLGLGLFGAAPARAQESTWDRVNTTKVVRLGVAAYAPFSYKDALAKGEGGVKQGADTWRGLAVETAVLVGDALGAKVEIVELTWASAIAAIQTGQVDLFFGLDGTPTRAAAIEFVNEPLYRYAMVFFGKEELAPKSWADLNRPEVKIGLVNGTNFDAMLQEYAPNATVQRFPSTSEVLAAFQTGQIDGTITTPAAADTARAKMRKGTVALLAEPEIYLPIVASIPPQSDERWRNFLDTSFAYWSDAGTTRKIYLQELARTGIAPDQISVNFIK